MAEWISVKDKLPDIRYHMQPVIVCAAGRVGPAYWNHSRRVWEDASGIMPYVTHWMDHWPDPPQSHAADHPDPEANAAEVLTKEMRGQ